MEVATARLENARLRRDSGGKPEKVATSDDVLNSFGSDAKMFVRDETGKATFTADPTAMPTIRSIYAGIRNSPELKAVAEKEGWTEKETEAAALGNARRISDQVKLIQGELQGKGEAGTFQSAYQTYVKQDAERRRQATQPAPVATGTPKTSKATSPGVTLASDSAMQKLGILDKQIAASR